MKTGEGNVEAGGSTPNPEAGKGVDDEDAQPEGPMSDQVPNSGRIDTTDHHDPAWHVHEVAKDFELIDAWKLPAAGEYEEFCDLTALFLSLDFANNEGSKASNFLFAARVKLGEIFNWDEDKALPIPGCEETSLRERLSPELRISTDEFDDGASEFRASEFQVVYQSETESLLELSNSTVHAAVHLAWVSTEGRRYVGQMGVYVKTRGKLGPFYMSAIAPFRHYIVYPALMRRIGSAWQKRGSGIATNS